MLNVVRLLGQLESIQRAVEPAIVMVTGFWVLEICPTSVLIRVWATLPIDSTGAVLLRCVVRLSRCVRWALVMLTSAVTVRTLLTRVEVVLTEFVLMTVRITRMVSMFRERLSMVIGPVMVGPQLREVVLSSVFNRVRVTFGMSVEVVVVVLSCVGPGLNLNRLIGCLAAVSRLVDIGHSSIRVVLVRARRVLLSIGPVSRLVSAIGYGADRFVKVSVRGLSPSWLRKKAPTTPSIRPKNSVTRLRAHARP